MLKNVLAMVNKYRVMAALALVALLCVSGSAHATDVTIEDVGNASGYISAAIVALGTLAGLVMGGFFGFWLVKKTFVWANKIG